MQAIVGLETQIQPEYISGQNNEASGCALLAGAALLIIGLDFSELTAEQHDDLNTVKMADMLMYENYHRYLRVSGLIGEILSSLRQDWRGVAQAKSTGLKGPLGMVVHYLTTLSSETQLVLQQKNQTLDLTE